MGEPLRGEAQARHEVGLIARRAGVVAGFTMLSRVLGAIRDMVVFHMFGATATTDAFFVAFTIPNVFRRLVAEGALTVAFVPVYSETRAKLGHDAARRFTDAAFTIVVAFVGLLVVGGMVFASGLVLLFASGFADNPTQFDLAALLTRWMFPYLLFISAQALCSGVLNANKRFWSPAAASALVNVTIIVTCLFAGFFAQPIYSLAVGVLLGGVAQFLIQLPELAKLDHLPRFTLALKQPGVAKLLQLMGPAVFGLAVYQINIIVLRQLASYLPSGHISYYYNADRLMELALGVFAIAIATAALPSLSDQAARHDHAAMLATFRQSFRMTNFITIPAAVGLAVVATPIVAVLYLHGKFTWEDSRVTAVTLVAFAPGLVAIATVRVVGQVFYAMTDTRTPVVVATVVLFLNTFVGMILVGPFEVAGLAATITLTSAAQAGMLLWLLRRKLGPMGLGVVLKGVLRQCAAAIPMGAVAYGICSLGTWERGPKALLNVALLAGAIGAAVAVYVGLVFAMGGDERRIMVDVVGKVRRRLGR